MLSETGLSDALGLYDRSNLEVRTLKSRLHEDEVGGIVEEVLNRVKAHANRLTDTIDAPSRLEVEKLCYALIADDPQEGHRIIESVYQDGASLDAIYLNYLAEAATVLGEWWDTDFVSFFRSFHRDKPYLFHSAWIEPLVPGGHKSSGKDCRVRNHS